MPIYGIEKRREVARSLLPSKRRRGARDDLASIKRAARRAMRENLSIYCGPWGQEVEEALDADPLDFCAYPNRDIRWAVDERREADKLSTIRRWGPSAVKGVRLEDRVSKLRAILPDTTAGRHAITHLEYEDFFYCPFNHDGGMVRWNSALDEEARFLRACKYALVEKYLKELEGTHREVRFNALLAPLPLSPRWPWLGGGELPPPKLGTSSIQHIVQAYEWRIWGAIDQTWRDYPH